MYVYRKSLPSWLTASHFPACLEMTHQCNETLLENQRFRYPVRIDIILWQIQASGEGIEQSQPCEYDVYVLAVEHGQQSCTILCCFLWNIIHPNAINQR